MAFDDTMTTNSADQSRPHDEQNNAADAGSESPEEGAEAMDAAEDAVVDHGQGDDQK